MEITSIDAKDGYIRCPVNHQDVPHLWQLADTIHDRGSGTEIRIDPRWVLGFVCEENHH